MEQEMNERLFCEVETDGYHNIGCGIALHKRDMTNWDSSYPAGWVYFQCPKCFLEVRHFKWQVDKKRYEKEKHDSRERNGRKLFLEDTFHTTVCNIHEFMDYESASSEVMNVLNFVQEEVINDLDKTQLEG